jgi:adenylylsulfate kinase-like enzyme
MYAIMSSYRRLRQNSLANLWFSGDSGSGHSGYTS